MSRSRKKNAICGVASGSEKQDKRRANRKFRRREKIQISNGDIPVTDPRETSDVWCLAKDGKWWFGVEDEEYIEKLMRK